MITRNQFGLNLKAIMFPDKQMSAKVKVVTIFEADIFLSTNLKIDLKILQIPIYNSLF